MSIAIAAMSTGLGAIFLDLRQRNPAAIVSGFGGTLNLVLSLLYMLSTVLPFGAVFQLRLLGRIGVRDAAFTINMLYIWLAVATLLATFLPLIAGRKSLLAREY
jgi:ABC-2 type transport system permease protein